MLNTIISQLVGFIAWVLGSVLALGAGPVLAETPADLADPNTQQLESITTGNWYASANSEAFAVRFGDDDLTMGLPCNGGGGGYSYENGELEMWLDVLTDKACSLFTLEEEILDASQDGMIVKVAPNAGDMPSTIFVGMGGSGHREGS